MGRLVVWIYGNERGVNGRERRQGQRVIGESSKAGRRRREAWAEEEGGGKEKKQRKAERKDSCFRIPIAEQ